MTSKWQGPAARARHRWMEQLYGYMRKAGDQSAALGDPYIGPEHLLLALASDDERTAAADALRAAGADHARLLEALRANGEAASSRTRKRLARGLSPKMYEIHGLAQGFAAAHGAKHVAAEHLLLALLWEPQGRHASVLESLGTTRAKVQRRLADHGSQVAPTTPPRADDTRWGDYTTIRLPGGDAWQLATMIRRLLPEGAPFGFNFGNGKAWFRTGDGIELAPLIGKARRLQLAERRKLGGTEQPQPPPRARRTRSQSPDQAKLPR